MLRRVRNWWIQWRCPHWQTAVHTFIENDGGALVRRRMVCLNCGKPLGLLSPISGSVLIDMLEQAKRLPQSMSTARGFFGYSIEEQDAGRDAEQERMEQACERDGGHVYEVRKGAIQRCTFCGKAPAGGDHGHVVKRD